VVFKVSIITMEIESPTNAKDSAKGLPIGHRKDPSAFLSRMENYQKVKKAKIEEKRHNLDMEVEKELQNCSFKPKINQGYCEKRTLEDLEQWNQAQKAKRHAKQLDQAGQERLKSGHKGLKTPRSQTHIDKRFIEFDSDHVLNPETNHAVVENRLHDLNSTYKSNHRVKAMVYGAPPPVDYRSTGATALLRTKTPEVERTRRLEEAKTGKQAKAESLMAERNKVKQIIHKTAQEGDEEIDFVTMNAADPTNSSTNVIKRKPVGLETVKNLKQKIRAEILS